MLGLLSTGAMAMTVAECGKPKLPVYLNQELFPEHAVLDFSKLSGSQVGKKTKSLRAMAKQRGWLYRGSGIDMHGSSIGAAGGLP